MTDQTLPLFYKQIAPLNKQKHGSWRIHSPTDYGFASQANSIYIAAVEFGRAAREYPIVFGRNQDGSIFPVALLGLRQNQNLYVDREGKWNANYIPAYVRRYPFILAAMSATEGSTNYTVCVDESYDGFSRDGGQGEALFDDSGKESPLLQQSIDFLKEYQGHVQLTNQFCQNLMELELLEDVRADIRFPDGSKHALGGFLCVNKKRLKQLEGEKLAELCKSDQLELIYVHLLSLQNLESFLKQSQH